MPRMTTDKLPRDLEAERALLGAILLQNDRIESVIEAGIITESFYMDSHKSIYAGMLALYERNVPIDLVTVKAELMRAGTYDQSGGIALLTGLFEDSFTTSNTSSYARIVAGHAKLRKISKACSEINSRIHSGVENIDDFVNAAEAEFFAATGTSARETFRPMGDVVSRTVQKVEEWATSGREVMGLSTGFTALDRIINGLVRTQVIVVAARPGMGKTSFILSVIMNTILKENAIIALFSLEMSDIEIGLKFISMATKIPAGKLKTGNARGRDWDLLLGAADKLSKSKLHIDSQGGISVLEIRSRCRKLKRMAKGLDLIVIDYLQLMSPSQRLNQSGVNEVQVLSEISKQVKELAKELDVPIVLLSQLNRGSEQAQSKDMRPRISNLRGSGSIEQDADIVILLHREDYYDKECENPGIAEVHIAKNRHGPTETVELAWIKDFTLFANLEKDISK